MKTFSPTKTPSASPAAMAVMKKKSVKNLLSRDAGTFHVQLKWKCERVEASISNFIVNLERSQAQSMAHTQHKSANLDSTQTISSMEPSIGDCYGDGRTACSSNDRNMSMNCEGLIRTQKGEFNGFDYDLFARKAMETCERQPNGESALTKSSIGETNNRSSKFAYTLMEKFTREINEILNKIAPQNFEKLMNTLHGIKIVESCMLTKLINLIFEKAISEQGFAHLYAEMCASLEARKPLWDFLDIVHNRDSNQYFWTKDLKFDESELSGPFRSFDDCCDRSNCGTHYVTRLQSFELQIVQIVLIKDIIIQVILFFQRLDCVCPLFFTI